MFLILLLGFERRCVRGRQALGITANYINNHTKADSVVKELGGLTCLYSQQFFKDIKQHCGIDLENFVYFRNETHYFVMTAKKQCLLEKGILLQVC